MPFNRRTSLGYVANRLGRLAARALEQRLAEHRVPIGQFPVLLMLWEEEGITQSEIARRLEFEQPTIANTLRRMERDGLVLPVTDPTNRRKVLVYLTDKARTLRAPLTAAAHEINERALAHLEPGEAAMFFATVAKLTAAFARDEEHGPPVGAHARPPHPAAAAERP